MIIFNIVLSFSLFLTTAPLSNALATNIGHAISKAHKTTACLKGFGTTTTVNNLLLNKQNTTNTFNPHLVN